MTTQSSAEDFTFELPFRPPLFDAETGASPIELRSISVAQEAATIENARISIQERTPFFVYADWIRRPAPGTLNGKVQFRIVGAGPTLIQDFSIVATPWPIGVVRSEDYMIAFPPLRYSGTATLYVDFQPQDAASVATLWAQPIFIRPTTVSSNLDLETLRETFGARALPLAKSFRLGPGARIELSLPMEIRDVRGIGLVSHSNYDNESKTGEPVARIDFLRQDGAVSGTFIIRSGITTAKRDHDEYPPGFLKTRKVAVYQSERSPRPSRFTHQAYDVHDYAARMPLDAPVEATALRVTYLREYGILQIAELLIYPGARPRS